MERFFETAPIEPTKELETALREAYPDKTELTAEQVDTTTIRLPLLKIMSHKADQKAAPVYAYVFTYGNSYHGAEIPYVFQRVSGSGEEQELAEQVSQAWINLPGQGDQGQAKSRNGSLIPEKAGQPCFWMWSRNLFIIMIRNFSLFWFRIMNIRSLFREAGNLTGKHVTGFRISIF